VLPDADVIALKAGQIVTVHLRAALIQGVIGCSKHTIQFASRATLDTGSVLGGAGNSRTRIVSFPAVLAVILVLFTVTPGALATVPFVVNQTLAAPGYLFTPTHWLLVVALLLVILAVDVVFSPRRKEAVGHEGMPVPRLRDTARALGCLGTSQRGVVVAQRHRKVPGWCDVHEQNLRAQTAERW
jgi:hypothetical protein